MILERYNILWKTVQTPHGSCPDTLYCWYVRFPQHFDDRVICITLHYCQNTGTAMNWPCYLPDLTLSGFFLGLPEKQKLSPKSTNFSATYLNSCLFPDCTMLLLQMEVILKTSFFSFCTSPCNMFASFFSFSILQRHLLVNFFFNMWDKIPY